MAKKSKKEVEATESEDAGGEENDEDEKPAKKSKKDKKAKKVMENDGNLANNAKPYDKVTHGDVIAGRLGKDEYGGKKKKPAVKEEAGGVPEKPTGGSNAATPEDHNRPIKKKAMDDAMAAANKTATGPLVTAPITKQGVTKEEVESIDELSKNTLGSYVKKAKEHAVGLGVGLGVAAMKRRDRSDVADKLKQRTKNIDRAVDRITNEEVDLPESVDETIIAAPRQYDIS